jgi:hypothetical protein
MDESQADIESDHGRIGRRDALKKAAVGAGVAGIVWTAPRIADLSLAPDYAAASSGGCSGVFTFNIALPGSTNDHSDLEVRDFTAQACGNFDGTVDSLVGTTGDLLDLGFQRTVMISRAIVPEATAPSQM